MLNYFLRVDKQCPSPVYMRSLEMFLKSGEIPSQQSIIILWTNYIGYNCGVCSHEIIETNSSYN